ncbi:MAG: hypothetical protein IJ682_03670 [Lachnospiraceae bacterium]|nr:hypothetical protein [Lachnospiraceae bacterium]
MPELTSARIEKSFRYRIDGKVYPYHSSSDNRNEIECSMICHLGLNAPYLVRNRRLAFENTEIMDEDEYTEEEWWDIVEYYDTMDENGKYVEYCNAIIDMIVGTLKF